MKRYFIILLVCLYPLISTASGKKFIKPNNRQIKVTGAFFLKKSSKKVVINRFNAKTLDHPETFMNADNANTQSGVIISFVTNSPEIIFYFEKRDDAKIRFGSLGIFMDGELFAEIKLKKDEPASPIVFKNPGGKQWAKWEIVLPPYYGMNFTGIEIDENCELKKTPETSRKMYVAIGNSITQGTGQKASYQTYPFLLAQKRNWELYNLGVGGSKISWPVARMLKGKKIDIITILWGYNDWNAGLTIENQIGPFYKKLLETLLKTHPETEIYCILPTVTTREKPKKGHLTLDEIRQAQAEIVNNLKAQGHHNLHLIHGEKITDIAGLKDKVHFSVEGAGSFAESLDRLIEP